MDTWVALAKQYDAKDRWYLEALGIAARGREEAIYARLRAQRDGITPAVFNQLLVELRPKTALPDLIAVVNDGAADVRRRLQALDALGSMQCPEAAHAVVALAVSDGAPRPLG